MKIALFYAFLGNQFNRNFLNDYVYVHVYYLLNQQHEYENTTMKIEMADFLVAAELMFLTGCVGILIPFSLYWSPLPVSQSSLPRKSKRLAILTYPQISPLILLDVPVGPKSLQYFHSRPTFKQMIPT